jgi:hypothetical protein
MPKAPQVCGIVLCRKMTVDMATQRMSLDGIFPAVDLSRFPPTSAFTVYAALFDGRGEGAMKLTFTHLESETDVYYHERWLSFPQGGMTTHYEVIVRLPVFTHPGRYTATLSFEGAVLSVRYIDVFRR